MDCKDDILLIETTDRHNASAIQDLEVSRRLQAFSYPSNPIRARPPGSMSSKTINPLSLR